MSGIIKWLKDKQDNIVVPKTLAKCVFTEKGNNLQTLSSKALYLGTEGSTTQLPSVNPTMIISDLDYSIEEQLTGKRWIDGKPIYQKSFEFESGAGAQSRTIYEDKNSFLVDINSNMNNVTEAPYFKYIETDNADGITISFHQSSQYSNKKYSVTIQYTKTTDTASSPVELPKIETIHTYSEEEQVVGKWIDGKDIYERVIVLERFVVNANSWYETNIIFNFDKTLKCYLITDDGVGYPAIVSQNNGKMTVRHFRNDNLGFNTIIVQYIKTE